MRKSALSGNLSIVALKVERALPYRHFNWIAKNAFIIERISTIGNQPSTFNTYYMYMNTLNQWHVQLDCPLSKGNQAPHLKFERPYGKISGSKKVLKNWCVPLTGKLNEAISAKIWRIKKNFKKWKSMTFFFLVLHLKPILLLN